MVLELDEQVRALTGRLVRLSGMGSWRGWGQVSILNLQSTGDIRLGCDPCVKKLSWRRAWHPTPGFWPGESHGQRSLAGYSPWGCKESDTTEQLTLSNVRLELTRVIYFPCLSSVRP